MNSNIDRVTHTDIYCIVAMARQQRSDALGELIAVGGRKALVAIAARIDRALHVLLMSPTQRRWAK